MCAAGKFLLHGGEQPLGGDRRPTGRVTQTSRSGATGSYRALGQAAQFRQRERRAARRERAQARAESRAEPRPTPGSGGQIACQDLIVAGAHGEAGGQRECGQIGIIG